MRTLAFVLASFVALSACDSTLPEDGLPAPPVTPAPSDTRTPAERGSASPETFRALGLQMSRFGLSHGFGSISYSQDYGPSALTIGESRVWLSGRQDGADRIGGRNLGRCPGETIPISEATPFLLSANVDYRLGSWPTDLGAPVEADGTPRVYGDHMAWDVSCPDPSESSDILRDLRVETALYMHEDVERVRFVRFEITNTGTGPVTDFRAGFYADLDVGGYGYWSNLVGVDGPMTYAYVRQDYDGQDGHPSALGAMQLLESPDAQTAVQRVIYRNRGPGDPPTLGERDSVTPVFRNALRGLDNDGSPIRNPVTDEVTTRMYTGDPVAGTGWLDGTLTGGETGWDIRALNASGPTTLAPGQATVLTVALVAGQGADLEGSLDYARTTLADVAARPALWAFPTDDDAPARR